jgi:hypothetical protein
LPRSIASAASTPKIALSGTAIAATSTVSQNALIAAGVVMASHTGPMPCSNVRQKIIPTGTRSSRAR